MGRIRFSRRALQDIDQILDYVEANRPSVAAEISEDLIRTCQNLSDSPMMGSSFDHWQRGLRAMTCRSYVVYFRPESNGITVVRILHGAQNAESLLRGKRR